MKAKSNILSKSTVEQAVKEVVKHVKRWTRKELEVLLNTNNSRVKIPIIVPLDDHCYLIGNYACCFKDDCWSLIYRNNDKELQFQNKSSALFYAICQQTSRYQLAEQILKYDNDILRLKFKAELYRNRYYLAKKNKRSGHSSEVYSCRYNETVSKIGHARVLLEKSLKSAKYFNL